MPFAIIMYEMRWFILIFCHTPFKLFTLQRIAHLYCVRVSFSSTLQKKKKKKKKETVRIHFIHFPSIMAIFHGLLLQIILHFFTISFLLRRRSTQWKCNFNKKIIILKNDKSIFIVEEIRENNTILCPLRSFIDSFQCWGSVNVWQNIHFRNKWKCSKLY